MKNKNGIYIIGVDHGYGNIKTANCCFPTGVENSDTEPTFGPSGMAERLNCCEKNRWKNTRIQRRIVARS